MAGLFNASTMEALRKGLGAAVNVASSAVSKAAEVAKDLAEDLTSFKGLKDYRLTGHVASAGPGGAAWKIYSAVNKKAGAVFPEASVWILDKKALVEQASRAGRARGFDTFFEQQRRGCNQLLRLKHPGILRVLEPLEESPGQMVMVTEPVWGSVANGLTQFRDVPSAPPERAGAVLSPLERKYGLHGVAETLHFLHHEAKLVHANLHPGAVIICRDGAWKLAGFEFVTSSADGFVGGGGGSGGSAGAGVQLAFEYASAAPSPWEEWSQPPLGFTAPELVGGCLASSDVSITAAADCFSLAALAHLLVAGKELLPVGSSTGEYRSRLRMLAGAQLHDIPASLQGVLQQMVAMTPAARPNAAAFASCQFFQEDMLLRCLLFLDSMLQRETGQKVAFLKDLSGGIWQQFDARLLQHRVLPPVVQQMRSSEVVALAALPLVLAIMGGMQPEGFAASGILPVLPPIFQAADGEVLLALVKHVGVFYRLMPPDAHATVLVPLMLRAFDSANSRAQEELLRALSALAPQEMPYQLLREAIMPRVVALCLRTTSLVVRVASLSLMAQAAHRLDKEAAGSMLDVCSQIVAVDRSAGTAMAVLKLGDAIGRHYGPEVTAQRVLPLLCPLLLCPSLNTPQFGAVMAAIRGLLDRVAEKRGGEVSAAGSAAATAMAARGAGSVGAGSTGRVSSSTDLADGLFGGGAAPAGASPTAAAAAGGGRGGMPSWSTPVTAAASSSGGPTAAAAAAAASESWSAAAWSSSSLGALGGSGGSSGWMGSSGQQPQRPPAGAPPPTGIGSSVPAPDIFSDSNGNKMGAGGNMLSGLGLGGPSTFGGSTLSGMSSGPGSSSSSTPSWSLGTSTAALGSSGSTPTATAVATSVSDMFGGLAVGGSSSGGGGMQRQPQALRPPPSSSKPLNLLGGAGVSSSSGSDPFASLAAGSGGVRPPAAASGSGDPFSMLAAGGSGGGGGGDAFAGLAQQGAARPQQQQQQQQWGGSLI